MVYLGVKIPRYYIGSSHKNFHSKFFYDFAHFSSAKSIKVCEVIAKLL